MLKAIETALDQVPNLDEDRILRQFLGVINATVRTNYFQHDADGGRALPVVQVQSREGARPARTEADVRDLGVLAARRGVHLRGGARGGLRWSDRREDFRTEVLGLMKAQMVKNT
jgi:glutamate dehydrogenase